MKLLNNTILITGGTSGIGLGFAKRFVALGNTVIICGRREQRLEEIKKEYPEMITITCDISDSPSREILATAVIGKYPHVNILINNAGTQFATDLTHPVYIKDVEQEVNTNFIAPVHLSSLFAKQFIDQKQSAIINISSGLGFVPLAFIPVYCATKAAMHSLSLSMRYQFRKTSVSVFEIAPPSVDSELGYQRRDKPEESHGGIPIDEFVSQAITAIEHDQYEVGIGSAAIMIQQREEMFSKLNPL